MTGKFKANIPTASFIKTLGLVSLAIEQRNTVPILAYVKMIAESGGLTLRGTNLDMEIVGHIEDVSAKGEIALPADHLLRLAKSASYCQELTIEEDKDGHVRITAGNRISATMLSLPPSDYPALQMGEHHQTIGLPAGTLAYLIGSVSHAISTEETRYYLNGINLTAEKDMLRAVATNGHMLSTVTQRLGDEIKPFGSIILPRQALQPLTAIIGRQECTFGLFKAKNGVDPIFAEFELPRFVVRTRLIDGKFPDWHRVVPSLDGMKSARLDIADFIRSLRSINAYRGVRGHGRASKLTFRPAGDFSINVTDPDIGEIKVSLDCKFDAEISPDIGFNAVYLDTIAKTLKRSGASTLNMYVQDPGSPTRIVGETDAFGLHILMPMRV